MRTIAQAIVETAAKYPEHTHTYIDSAGAETVYTMPEVERRTARIAAGFQERGLKKGDRVGLVLIDPEEFILTFVAALRVGIVAVPLYPPMSMADLDAYIDKLTRIAKNAECKIMVASERVHKVLWQVVSQVPTMKTIVEMSDLLASTGEPHYPELASDDMAFLQYTSGSTSDPKGVIVTHGSLYANCLAITRDGLQVDPERDKTVSWLPLYHDMGLIGFVIAPLLSDISAVYIPTIRFLKRPNLWMETIHKHRGTITFCPPFALALAARRAKPEDLARWDLSCLRIVGVGAEPIQPEGVRQFTETFSSQCGMPANAVLSAYGMAEATLAMALKPVHEPLRTIHIDFDRFQEDKTVVECEPGAPGSAEHVSCGPTFPDHELGIFDEQRRRLPDGVEGEIHFRGPSVAAGYFQNEEGTKETFFPDGWMATGDLGYMINGEVYVSGRLKDLIIINGRNIHPQAIEWPIYAVEGVRRGNVVAFSKRGATTEEVVICVETTPEPADDIAQRIKDVVIREFGIPVADVVVLSAGQLPKTSSGKLQRRLTRQLYQQGTLSSKASRTMGSSGAGITVAKHVARSFIARVRNIAVR